MAYKIDTTGVPRKAASAYYAQWKTWSKKGESMYSEGPYTFNHTPQLVTRRVLDAVDLSGTLLVINVELAFELMYIRKKNPSEVTLWAPSGGLRRTARALKCNFVSSLTELNEMVFDVVLQNPPYNDETSSRSNSNHKIAGKNLAKDFIELGLQHSRRAMVVICPYTNRTMSPKAREKYAAEGLHTIIDVTKDFASITSIVCCAIFDRTKKVESINNVFDSDLLKAEKSLAEIFVAHPGNGRYGRGQYEHLLQDSGAHKIFVTTKVIKYTDDRTIVENINDSTVGNWRVVINHNASKKSIGRVVIADPKATLTYSVSCLIVSSEAEAIKYKEYLESDKVTKIVQAVRTGMVNTKRDMQYIPQL